MERKFLIGNRLHLRPLDIRDIEGNYITWFDDAEISAWNSHHIFPKSKKQVEEYILNPSADRIALAIVSSSDNVHIGNISLQNIDFISRTAEYAIILGEKAYWGKGYAKEASNLIITHGFNSLNLRRISLGTTDKNVSMKKLAVSLGFVEEGRLREHMYRNGMYVDVIQFGLLKSEWSV